MPRESRIKIAIIYLLVFLLVSCFVFPPVWMVITSFKNYLDIISWPPTFLFTPTLDNWQWFLLGTQFSQLTLVTQEGTRILREYLPNSLVIAFGTMGLTVFIASLSAYALARFTFRGRKPMAFIIIGTRMLPPIAAVVPLFILMMNLNLRDTHLGLVLAYTAFNLPLVVWILWGFIKEIPADLEESAMVDGCTRTGALFRIIFPVIAPGLGAACIFSFLGSWNDFAIALFLVSQRAKTVPLAALTFMTEGGMYWGPMAVYGTIYMIPTIIFAIFVQKYIVKGLTMGAVKG